MAGELTTKSGDLAEFLGDNARGIADAIKPLINEIYLFDSFIAGTTHLVDKTPISNAAQGDRLLLRREDNIFDSKAILVLNSKNQKLGYIPERDNVIFSRLMDAGKVLSAKITDIEQKGSFTQIQIDIYLVDF